MRKLLILLACCGLFIGCEAAKTKTTPKKTDAKTEVKTDAKTDAAPEAPKKTE